MYHALMATLPWQPSFIHVDEWLRGRSNPQPNRKSTEIRGKKKEDRENATCQSAHLKETNWQQYVMPSWNYRGTRIPELEGDRNQWEQRRRFCLLSASLTASLVRHGGQTPGRKHDKNTRMTKASRSLNVYNTVFWKVQVDWALTGSVLHPFEFRRNTVRVQQCWDT